MVLHVEIRPDELNGEEQRKEDHRGASERCRTRRRCDAPSRGSAPQPPGRTPGQSQGTCERGGVFVPVEPVSHTCPCGVLFQLRPTPSRAGAREPCRLPAGRPGTSPLRARTILVPGDRRAGVAQRSVKPPASLPPNSRPKNPAVAVSVPAGKRTVRVALPPGGIDRAPGRTALTRTPVASTR